MPAHVFLAHFRESSSPASHVLQWSSITGCVSIDGPCILVCEPIPANGLHPRAFGAEMSMDACATGARSRWTLKRVKCGKSYMGSCDGLHGYLDGQPTSSAFGLANYPSHKKPNKRASNGNGDCSRASLVPNSNCYRACLAANGDCYRASHPDSRGSTVSYYVS